MTQAVVFLARGEGGGRAAAEAFFESYRRHPAGRPHDLVVLVKGWTGEPGLADVRRWAGQLSAMVIDLPDDGLDWGAYFRAAERLNQSWLCFLNTHSRLRRDGWLDALRRAAEAPGIGAAGATGSWGTLAPNPSAMAGDLADLQAAEPGRAAARLKDPRHLLRTALGYASAMLHFPTFPNPHLRSNGFLVRRDRFATFAGSRRHPCDKDEAHRLESGRRNLTLFLQARGLASVVVAADGRPFAAADWPASGTFRVPAQPGLLIADNQTEAYLAADRRGKRLMERAAWGNTFTP